MGVLLNNKEKFLNIIQNLISFNKISHAYLIEIDNYENDMKYINSFIKQILCHKQEKIIDCGECNVCRQIDSNTYLDLRIIEPDGVFIKKNQLLELQKEFVNKSLLDNKRIYVIKEADKLNDASANTILKFLEEPEDNIVAILLTTNRYKVLETIISRCQILSLSDDNFQFDYAEDTIELLEMIIKKQDLFINYNKLLDVILPSKQEAKNKFVALQNGLICYLNYINDSSKYLCDDRVCSVLNNVNTTDIINYISVIEDELKKLEYNVNYKLWLDSLFARLIGG